MKKHVSIFIINIYRKSKLNLWFWRQVEPQLKKSTKLRTGTRRLNNLVILTELSQSLRRNNDWQLPRVVHILTISLRWLKESTSKPSLQALDRLLSIINSISQDSKTCSIRALTKAAAVLEAALLTTQEEDISKAEEEEDQSTNSSIIKVAHQDISNISSTTGITISEQCEGEDIAGMKLYTYSPINFKELLWRNTLNFNKATLLALIYYKLNILRSVNFNATLVSFWVINPCIICFSDEAEYKIPTSQS